MCFLFSPGRSAAGQLRPHGGMQQWQQHILRQRSWPKQPFCRSGFEHGHLSSSVGGGVGPAWGPALVLWAQLGSSMRVHCSMGAGAWGVVWGLWGPV